MTYKGNKNPITLSANPNGVLKNIRLPQGPKPSYELYISVNIIDNEGGLVVYNIKLPVIVYPNDNIMNKYVYFSSLVSVDPYDKILLDLNSGNLNLVSSTSIALAIVLNIEDTTNVSFYSIQNKSLNVFDPVDSPRGYLRQLMTEKINQLIISNISSIKVISSALSVITQSLDQVSTTLAVIFKKYVFFYKFKVDFSFIKATIYQ